MRIFLKQFDRTEISDFVVPNIDAINWEVMFQKLRNVKNKDHPNKWSILTTIETCKFSYPSTQSNPPTGVASLRRIPSSSRAYRSIYWWDNYLDSCAARYMPLQTVKYFLNIYQSRRSWRNVFFGVCLCFRWCWW